MPKKHKIEFNGKTASLKEHCEDLGLNYGTIRSRHRHTKESYEKCLEHYAKHGVVNKHMYTIKNNRLYRKWREIKNRCENPNSTHYKDYGGRGIKVCERWQKYENFEEDLLESFLAHVEKYGIKDTTIDRWPNNDGDYEPNNVRWATIKEQSVNKRSTRMVTDDLNASQFAEKYNLNYQTLLQRLNLGWTVEKILNTPTDIVKYYLPCGKSLRKHCQQNNYCYQIIIEYIQKYNMQPHEALAYWIQNKANCEV